MKRILLGLGLALAASASVPASASVIRPHLCGGTFQPQCDVCIEKVAGDRVCVPVNVGDGA